ncbi:MAG: tetratricopeptide repeat protein [Anaerolineales bacterium]|nr:tetratricopeptide repeat protein [Anaerolineales bacterium]
MIEIDRALEIAPKYHPAMIEKGITLREMKRYEDALVEIDRALEIAPKYHWGMFQKGRTLRKMKRYEDALIEIDRALEIAPRYHWAMVERGITLREKKQYEDAMVEIDRALEIDPQGHWAMVEKGITLREKKQYEEAMVAFDRALEIDPEYEWGIERKLELLLWLNMYNQVVELVNKVKVPSEDMRNARALANIYGGDFESGRKELKEIVAIWNQTADKGISPDFYVAWILGEKEESKKYIQDIMQTEAGMAKLQDLVEGAKDDLFGYYLNIQGMVDLIEYLESVLEAV